MAVTATTHITQYSTQKSYASLIDLEDAGATNLLSNQTGRVYNILLEYNDSTAGYVKLYDSKAVTHGTDHPIMVLPVKGTGWVQSVMSQSGIKISSALSMAASNLAGTGSGGSVPAGTVKAFISGS